MARRATGGQVAGMITLATLAVLAGGVAIHFYGELQRAKDAVQKGWIGIEVAAEQIEKTQSQALAYKQRADRFERMAESLQWENAEAVRRAKAAEVALGGIREELESLKGRLTHQEAAERAEAADQVRLVNEENRALRGFLDDVEAASGPTPGELHREEVKRRRELSKVLNSQKRQNMLNRIRVRGREKSRNNAAIWNAHNRRMAVNAGAR